VVNDSSMNRCSKLLLWVTELVLMNVTRWILAAELTSTSKGWP
jgi:hypothetical protein